MGFETGLIEWIAECTAPLGTLTKRAMMGGATLYLDGQVFAILTSDGVLRFKADAVSDAVWDAEGADRFTFAFDDGRVGSMNYRRAPDNVFDDPDAMLRWARLGLEAGLRAPKKAKKSKKD
ncbi:competence protein TfoX [Sphingomonas sp. Leaf33]|uniref:TfoX/Sxy family protein n=1 Tax=Sphingomonas sp. Leaf33 TaxID=1736215 RepID=UPI0006FB2C36|nr:TfoX/Sxy family protein [Sphingomonas sp. Leaf33]KQN25376.1 competence protein TfoX [Sphingomonas sp. Leaf33]